MEEPDKLAHLLHRLRTVAPGSSSLQPIVEHLRNYLRRHPGQSGRVVAEGGVAIVTRLLQQIVPVEEGGRTQAADAPESHPVVLGLLSLMGVLTTEHAAKVALSNDNAVKLFVDLLHPKYPSEVHLRTIRSLLNLLYGNPPAVPLLASAPITAVLASFLDSPELRDPALRLMRALSPAPHFRRALLRQSVLPKLTPLLAVDEPALLQSTLLTISSLVADLGADAEVAKQLRGSLVQLVQLAGYEEPGVQQSALDLLTRLAGSSTLRMDMGSKGVVACFLEQLGFDPRQTTVDGMAKKLAFALTLCCREGYNRAKLLDLGGLRALVGMLGHELYRGVHLHILAGLAEFRHDSHTMHQLIHLGVLPLVAEYMTVAVDVCRSSAPSTSRPDPPDAPPALPAPATPRARQFPPPSPAVSPPSIPEELQRDLGRLAVDSPPWPASPGEGTSTPARTPGRYSPVLMDVEDGHKTPERAPVKRALSGSGETSTKRVRASPMGQGDAEKCLQYALAFLDSISNQQELTKFLATRSLLGALLACMQLFHQPDKTDGISNPVKPYLILQNIIRDRKAFEHVVKSGLALLLAEKSPCEAVEDAKGKLLRTLRYCAEGDFGFGELLHLCLRAPPGVRLTCMASAAVLLVGRAERLRMWERNGVLDQLMDALGNVNDGDEESSRSLAQAVHGFFSGQQESEDEPMAVSYRDPALGGCQYAQLASADGDALFALDDGTCLHAHRPLLAQASDVFAALLGSNFMEGTRQTVRIRETDALAFSGIVHILCGCRFASCPLLDQILADPTGLALLDLYQLSDQYLLLELRDFTLTLLLHDRLSPANVHTLVQGAEALCLTGVSEAIVQRVLRAPEMETSTRAAHLRALLGGEGREGVLTFVRALITSSW